MEYYHKLLDLYIDIIYINGSLTPQMKLHQVVSN